MNEVQLTALYGPLYPYAKYQPGDRIAFTSSSTGAQVTDRIMWIVGPSDGRPMIYIMENPDPSTSLPQLVYQSEVVEE